MIHTVDVRGRDVWLRAIWKLLLCWQKRFSTRRGWKTQRPPERVPSKQGWVICDGRGRRHTKLHTWCWQVKAAKIKACSIVWSRLENSCDSPPKHYSLVKSLWDETLTRSLFWVQSKVLRQGFNVSWKTWNGDDCTVMENTWKKVKCPGNTLSYRLKTWSLSCKQPK